VGIKHLDSAYGLTRKEGQENEGEFTFPLTRKKRELGGNNQRTRETEGSLPNFVMWAEKSDVPNRWALKTL